MSRNCVHSPRFMARSSSRNVNVDSSENEFENSQNSARFPPPRTPLNTIQDPSQYQKESQQSDLGFREKLEPTQFTQRSFDKRIEAVDNKAGNASNANHATPKVSNRNGKAQSEPNSAQITPARCGARVSLGGGGITSTRFAHCNGGRGVSSCSRVSRAMSIADSDFSIEAPHFELEEDPSFWADQNVQVLIRIRPLSAMERVSQGHTRCLRQESARTLVWLGQPETRFTFDHIACETISQENLFRVAGLPVVENCMSGYNSCMFAYGQTGSGKTYTMMGEIHEVEGKLNRDCGITPRIFEYLFSRIKMEEEGRRDENLKFSCKCSFLEIYNEQITDLLEPSSTNLQLREDMEKGVYVENLTESTVRTVNDVLKLLLQGAANRKIAATHMNSESSRSHSVFTCIIESRWEKDSLTHFRFARLNLVDLAGSERQKSSGAEGDRLKEAANINKSLSTLGLVIMSLVDLAHGKHRHVPYRDSRLTFLLQDSLGGNSKTMIIANVSPSICASSETLSTLKFSQRAKLIQNNAKVNEDASGDITALQREIRHLKGQLSSLRKNQNISRSLSTCAPILEESRLQGYPEKCHLSGQKLGDDYHYQDNDTAKELEECKNMNSRLMREVDELQTELRKYLNCFQTTFNSVTGFFPKDAEEFADKYSLIDTMSIRADCGDEMASYAQADNAVLPNKYDKNMGGASVMQSNENQTELMDARLLIEAMGSEQIRLIDELQLMQEQNEKCMAMLSNKDKVGQSVLDPESCCPDLDVPEKRKKAQAVESNDKMDRSHKDALRTMLEKLSRDLEETRLLNCRYQEHHASQLSHQHQVEAICEQVESETAKKILYLQEEVAGLQSELQETSQENTRLKNTIAAKEAEITALSLEWERATLELTSFLLDGSKSLKDASNQIESIVSSFPEVNVWISEHVQNAAKVCIEKEEKVLLLQKSLEDAQEMAAEMELKLSTLKGATIALNEFQQQDNIKSTEEGFQFFMQLHEKNDNIKILEQKLKLKEDQLAEVKKHADAAFLVVKWLSDSHKVSPRDDIDRDFSAPRLVTPLAVGDNIVPEMKAVADILAVGDIKAQLDLLRLGVLECHNAMNASLADAEVHMASLQADILQISSVHRSLVQDMAREIDEMRHEFLTLKENHKNFPCFTVRLQSTEAYKCLKFQNQCHMLHQMKNELARTNGKLDIILDCITTKDGDLSDADEMSDDLSALDSDFSAESIDSVDNLDQLSCTYCTGKTMEDMVAMKLQESEAQEMQKCKNLNETVIFDLRKELEMAFDAFSKLYIQLTTLLNKNNTGESSAAEMNQVDQILGSTTGTAEVGCNYSSEAVTIHNIDHVRSFFSKFEEAHATIREADLMLNALVKANENSKQLNDMWLQAGQELIVERASLVEELEQLKSSIDSKDEENKLLQSQVHYTTKVAANSISLLQDSFLQMQREVEDTLTVFFADVFSMGQEMLDIICNSRSSLEDMCSEIIEKGFARFVLDQCHIGSLTNQVLNLNGESSFQYFRQQGRHPLMNAVCLSGQADIMSTHKIGINGEDQSEQVINLEDGGMELSHKNLMYENLSLKKELKRKEVLLEGLLFDLSLLQESASSTKDIRDETEKLILALSQVRQELEMKESQLDDLLVQQRKLENGLTDKEKALFMSNKNLEQARDTVAAFSDQNAELRVLLKDLYLRKTEAEEGLEEQKEIINGLEKEILHLTSSVEKELLSSVEAIEDNLRKVSSERDKLLEESCLLNDKLEMAYALADEKEAIAVEACQELEASKTYAEQKEEEVKILEHSVEELECTVNVLEKKVYEMDEEVERHRLIRDSLELELQALRYRLSTIENFTDIVDTTTRNAERAEDQKSMSIREYKLQELQEAQNQIKLLEKERAELNKEIKQCKECISELVLHSEAQASHYQQKYKILEAMVREVKTDSSSSTSAAPTLHASEKISTRTRGSSSPFRCIAGLVQQMNLEKEQELSVARLRIEELEASVASQQKEVLMLNTRLAATESMTHDVIRDLLGVKLDMTNYANLIDQHQVQKLVEEAHQHTEEILAKEQEILQLRKQLNDLIEERESCISDIHKKETDLLSAQITLEQLQERDQLLSAQNEMLKMDKTNLIKRVAEQDQMVKTLLETQTTQPQIQQTLRIKDNGLPKLGKADFTKRLAHSEKLLSEVNDELAQYRKSTSRFPHVNSDGQSSATRYRNWF